MTMSGLVSLSTSGGLSGSSISDVPIGETVASASSRNLSNSGDSPLTA